MTMLFRIAAFLPLPVLHALGVVLGWTLYFASPTYRARLRENLKISGLYRSDHEYRRLLRQAAAEIGKGVAELPAVWFRGLPEVMRLVRAAHGWELVEKARALGRGVIFLTPHLGCFEITALYGANRFPITVLYRSPKLAWMEPIVRRGRGRGGLSLASSDLRGVRALYRALKKNQAVGLLPDQAPGTGEGVWAEFFGKPAYTMTLAGRLHHTSGAPVILAFAKRLPRAQGYELSFRAVDRLPEEPAEAARAVNRALEDLIRLCPAQYLWSYNRYKTPAGAPPVGGAG